MAGNFYGADVAQLRQLAKDLANGANRLDQLGQQLGSSIASSPWRGHDGDRFRSDWTSAHLRFLKVLNGQAASGIQQASKALLAERRPAGPKASAGSTGGAGGTGSGERQCSRQAVRVLAQELTDKLEQHEPGRRDAGLPEQRRVQESGRWKTRTPPRQPWTRQPTPG
jgi:uncharacterized protein YukE